MKYHALCLVLCLAVFLAVDSVYADGGYFPRVEVTQETVEAYREDAQRAFLFYDASSGKQRLVLDVRTAAFSGDFVWLVPIPHVPDDPAAFLGSEVSEVSADGFDDLAAITDPDVTLVIHEVREPYASTGFSFACAPAAPGNTTAETSEQDLDSTDDTWAQRSTDSYALSLYTGDDFDQFVNNVSTDIGAGTASAVAAGRDALEGYFDATLLQDDGIPGPFSMLILEGTRQDEIASSPAVRLDYPTDAPFFALTVSQVGFEEHMDVAVFTAGPLPVFPTAGSIPFLAEIDFLDGTYVFGYGYDYWFYYPPDYYEPVGFVSASSLEGSGFDTRVEELLGEVRAEMGRIGLAAEHRSLQWTADMPYLDGLESAAASLVLAKYSRVYGSAADLEDIVFTTPDPAETPVQELYRSFSGHIRVHAAVHADWEQAPTGSADLSFLLALVFPAGIAVKKRLSRSSLHDCRGKSVHPRRR